MAVRLNRDYFNRVTDNFAEARNQGSVYATNENFALMIKELCLWLANANIAYRVINMGGGVKRITNEVRTCAKCAGRGQC